MIDSKQLPDWGPFRVEAQLLPDYDSSPDDVDIFTPKQVEAWRENQWSYVGLVVEVSFDGVEIGNASLWGIEYGFIPLTDEDDNLTEEPVKFFDPLEDYAEALEDVTTEAKADAMAFIERLQKIAIPV